MLRGEEPQLPPELVVELTANVPESMAKHLKLMRAATTDEDRDYHQSILRLLQDREAKEAQAMGDIL